MPKIACHSRHGRGLTLIEQIIVIACVGILTAILLPALTERGAYTKKLTCKNGLKPQTWGSRAWSPDNSSGSTTETLNPVWTKDPLATLPNPGQGNSNISVANCQVTQTGDQNLRSLLQASNPATNRLEIH
jgi:type II secretory pathway pseudopilin PulG